MWDVCIFIHVCVCIRCLSLRMCVRLHFNVPQRLRWGQGEVQEVLSIKGSLACAQGKGMTCSGECVIKGAAYSASHITLHSAPHLTITRQTSVQVPVHLSLFSALLSCTDPGCRSHHNHRHCSGPYWAWLDYRTKWAHLRVTSANGEGYLMWCRFMPLLTCFEKL